MHRCSITFVFAGIIIGTLVAGLKLYIDECGVCVVCLRANMDWLYLEVVSNIEIDTMRAAFH